MKKISTIIALTVASLQLSAQSVQDIQGRVFREAPGMEVKGSPYINNYYAKGSITTITDQVFDNFEFKFNLNSNNLIYKSSSGELMESTIPLKEFVIYTKIKGVDVPRLFRSGYPVNSYVPSNHFYEVLKDGDVQYLKYVKKDIFEQKEYSGSTSKVYQETVSYYIALKDSTPTQINRTAASILSVLSLQEKQLNDYIKDQKLNLKNDGDIVKLLTFYEGLLKG